MLSRGQRVFHVNSPDDMEKLDGWLRRGPKYEEIEQIPMRPRSIYLVGRNRDHGKLERIGVVIVMSKSFAGNEVLNRIKAWQGR